MHALEAAPQRRLQREQLRRGEANAVIDQEVSPRREALGAPVDDRLLCLMAQVVECEAGIDGTEGPIAEPERCQIVQIPGHALETRRIASQIAGYLLERIRGKVHPGQLYPRRTLEQHLRHVAGPAPEIEHVVARVGLIGEQGHQDVELLLASGVALNRIFHGACIFIVSSSHGSEPCCARARRPTKGLGDVNG